MKITKKLLSLALALAMLPVSAFGVSAAAEKASGVSYSFEKWNLNKITNNTPWNSEVDYMKPTLTGGYQGTSGLEISVNSPVEGGRYLSLDNPLSAKMTSGNTYRIKLRYKGDGKFEILANWQGRKFAYKYTTESTDGDWNYVYYDLKMPEGKEASSIAMIADQKQHNFVDDFSVQLLTDTNADGTPDTPDGVELVTDTGFSQVKSSYSFDVDDYYFSNSWKYSYAGTPEGAYMKVTKKYAHSDDYALYIQGETAESAATGGVYMIIEPRDAVAFTDGQTYYVEYYAMYTKGETEFSAQWFRDFKSAKHANWKKSEPDENGWIKHSQKRTITANRGNLWFIVDQPDEMLIDDLAVYLCDESGNPTGSNLVKDGGFENSSLNMEENKYELTDWKEVKNNVTSEDSANYFAEPTKTDAKNGEYSLHIGYPTITKSNHFVQIYKDINLAAGDYLVQYYIKGRSTAMFFATGNGGSLADPRLTKTGKFTDWTLNQQILKIGTDRTAIKFVGQNLDNVYIDDLEIYPVKAKDESAAISLNNYEKTGEAVVSDGFENVTENSAATKSNLVVYPVIAGGKLNVSWNNPKSNFIEDVKLYVDGVDTAITPIDKSSGAFNQMLLYGLTNGKEYTIKLVVTVDGEDYVYETKETPRISHNMISFGDWKWLRTEKSVTDETTNKTTKYYANSMVSAEEDETGNVSMRINSNIPETIGNIYANLISGTKTLRVDTVYVLKFKYKSEDISNFTVRQDCTKEGVDGVVYSSNPILKSQTTTDGWVEKEISLIPEGIYDDEDEEDTTYQSTLMFIVDKATGSLWIDDIELYAVDAKTGNLDTTDLFGGIGSFEGEDLEIAEPEYKLVAQDGKTTAINEIVAGNIEVTTKIKNNAMGDEFKAAVIVALYNGTNLVDLSVMEKTVAQSLFYLPADEFTQSVTVPEIKEGDNYNIKVMYWNGIDSLSSLKANDTLPEA